MMKKILLVTSVYTGAGHKSISDSLTEQFSGMPDVEVQVIDGFELMGKTGVRASRMYGFLTRHAMVVFNTAWRITMVHPPRFALSERLCSRRFMECIRVYHPDLILTVHSLFNTVLTRMLEAHGLNIPVVVVQADPVDIHSTWCNPKACMTICSTREAYDSSVRQGMPAERLKILGFPVRSRFSRAAAQADAEEYDASRPLRCLLMSGGEGCCNLRAYAENILEKTNSVLTIICGRNSKLRDRLRKSLGTKYGERLTVLGFVPDIEREMLHSDLLITRGSPNTLFEAVTLNIPLVVIGPLPEQEKDNPRLIKDHDLGVVCRSPDDIPQIISFLLGSDALRLREIRSAQRSFRCLDNARNIAAYVAELTEQPEYTLQHTGSGK